MVRKAIIKSIISTLIGAALLGLSSVSVSAVGESASLSSSGVNFEITPTSANPNGTVAIGTDNLTVSSTCSSGYKLYISTTSNDETDSALKNADNAEYSIPAVSGTIASPTLINSSSSKNHWGFAMSSNDTGIASTGFVDPTVSNTSLFASIPTLDNMTVVRQKTSSADNETVNVYYGVNAGTDLTPGSYSSTVMYTMIMPSPCDYTLMFEDGVSEDDPVTSGVTKMPEMTTAGHGDTVNLGDYISEFAREGYSITGWKNLTLSESAGSDVIYGPEDVVNPNLSGVDIIKLAPVWTLNTYTVTLGSGTGISSATITVTKDTSTVTNNTGNSASGSSPSITVGYKSSVQIHYTVSSGYHFSEWEITSVDNYPSGAPMMTMDNLTLLSGLDANNNSAYGLNVPDSDVTLTAKAEGNKYTVHFDANGGTGEMAGIEMTYGASSTLPANTFTTPSSIGSTEYAFYGWSTEAQDLTYDAPREYTDGQTGTFNLIPSDTAGTGETTLYAVWRPQYDDIMQNWSGCTSLKISTTSNYEDASTYAKLLDTRNSVVYIVRRYNDGSGNCWMSENLRLTPGDSDPGAATISSGALATATSSSQGAGTVTFASSGFDITTSSNTGLRAYYGGNTTNGAYYTWSAALISCPAGWTLPTNAQYSSFLSSESIADSAAGSTKIQSAPYSFPTAGNYYKDSGGGDSDTGVYWSSGQYDSMHAYNLYFYPSNTGVNYNGKYRGYPIRCIQTNSTTMQSFSSSNCSAVTASTTENYEDKSTYRILKDTRNAVYYTVRRYADEKCWMAQNLALTPGSTPPTANVTSGSRALTTSDSQGSGTINFASGLGTSDTALYARYDVSNISPAKNTTYFTWPAAQIACPASWTLPSWDEWHAFLDDNDIINGAVGSTKLRAMPYDYTYTGFYDGSSFGYAQNLGYYWSSSVHPIQTANGYLLGLTETEATLRVNYKRRGYAVRCLHS